MDEYEALTGKGNKTEKIELKTELEEPQNEAPFDADDDLDIDENIVDIELYNVVSAFNVGCTLNLTELCSKFWAAWPKRAVSIFYFIDLEHYIWHRLHLMPNHSENGIYNLI